MRRANLELTVGFFVLIGLACLAYLAINLGKIEIYGKGYQISANFENASGLKIGSTVEVAGVEVGRVVSIQLTPSVSGPGRDKRWQQDSWSTTMPLPPSAPRELSEINSSNYPREVLKNSSRRVERSSTPNPPSTWKNCSAAIFTARSEAGPRAASHPERENSPGGLPEVSDV